MRPLIISSLAAILIGCAPQQAQQASLLGHSFPDTRTDSNIGAKAEKAINAKTGHPRHRRKANSDTKIAKPNRVPKMDTSSRVQPDHKSSTSINGQSTDAAKTETQQVARPDDKSSASNNAQSSVAAITQMSQAIQPDDKLDPVLKRAISAIAAKMLNSVSVELVEMKRSEKNASGKSIDVICGSVRGKSASGSDTGDRPFLYLVQEEKAYIGLYDIATSPYHNFCEK
jgi:hypothetical protein